MKQTIKILLSGLVLSLVVLTSCQKYEVKNTANQVGISKVVFYPSVVTNGDRLTLVAPGETFKDAGATAILNGASMQYTTTGTVGTSAGVYVLTYTAKTPDGYSASDYRTVVIFDASVTSNDFSGTYTRSSNGQTSTWTKRGLGVYTLENPGGAVGVTDTVTAVNYTGYKIAIPLQKTPGLGTTSSASESTTPGAPGTLAAYSWEIINAGYGTSIRNFTK